MKKLFAIAMVLMLCIGALSVCSFAAPDGLNSLAIVGTGIPGVGEWNPADAAGDMTEVQENIYEIVLDVTAGTSFKFKVAGNDAWDDAFNFGSATIVLGKVADLTNGGGSSDMTVNVENDGQLKITVDLNGLAVGGAATILVEEVVEVEPPVDPQPPVEGGEVIPGTGDMGLTAVAVALVAASAGLVATLTKKKED